MVMYNCCMGIMQAVGDSKHPLEYLIISSVINVVLDIVMIAVFHLGVAGAALATIIANFISFFLCLIRLMRTNEPQKVQLRKIRFDLPSLKLIIQYGLPSGLQNSIIALANVVSSPISTPLARWPWRAARLCQDRGLCLPAHHKLHHGHHHLC